MLFPTLKILLINLCLYFGIFVLLYISSLLFNLEQLREHAHMGMMVSGIGFAIYGVTHLLRAGGVDFYLQRWGGFITILAAPIASIACIASDKDDTVYESFMIAYTVCAYGISAYLYIQEKRRRKRLEEEYIASMYNSTVNIPLEDLEKVMAQLKKSNNPQDAPELIIPTQNTEQAESKQQAANE